jgi:hypothetical protein
MTPVLISRTNVGQSPTASLSSMTNPYNVGFHAKVTGTATFNVEISPQDPTLGAPTIWFVEPNFSAKTADTVGASTIPAQAVRVNITSGTGTVDLYIDQAGMR